MEKFYVDDKGNCVLTPEKNNNLIAAIIATGVALLVGALVLKEVGRKYEMRV